MIITVVCCCGQHNAIHDRDLETAHCVGCGQILLKPAAAAASDR